MINTKTFGSRYTKDFVSFSKSFAVSVLSLLPLVVWQYGSFFIFAFLFLFLYGIINIGAFSFLTAISESHLYKFTIYVLATCVNTYLLFEKIAFDPSIYEAGAKNSNYLLLFQVLALFVVIYFILEVRGRLKLFDWPRDD